ncbi:unnamed protein product, partial [marine sediment metagenome]
LFELQIYNDLLNTDIQKLILKWMIIFIVGLSITLHI